MTVPDTRWRTAAVAVGAGLALAFSAPAFAGVDDDFARLLQLNPGVSAQELKDSAMEYAEDNGITYAEALAQARAEAEAHLDEDNKDGNSGCEVKKAPGNADHKGDVFHAPASRYTIDYNHTGIYSATDAITEAPGGQDSNTFRAADRRYCPGLAKMSVDTSSANRNEAADYADERLTGKAYDDIFLFNKDDDVSELNCSELVWKAYKFPTGVDLDGNGLASVYPDDIKDSDLTDIYATVN